MLVKSTGPNLAASREFMQVVRRVPATARLEGTIMPIHDDYAITAEAAHRDPCAA
jgi:hypothetical protein